MNSRVAFQCDACKGTFHEDGLHTNVHGMAVAHICPACLGSGKEIRLSLVRSGPGKQFEFLHFMVVDKIE